MPQVLVCYIRNEGERNQKKTPRNQIIIKMVKRGKKKKEQAP
jgi:ketopantoate reductase